MKSPAGVCFPQDSFDSVTLIHVDSKFSLSRVETMESDYAEENISTEQPPPREEARVQGADGNQERPSGDKTPPSQRAQASDSAPLLDLRLPKEARLLKRADFLRVYDQGKRIEGRFMTVFILPGRTGRHRVGVTATKKAIGKAHDRNRAKRLLRESFRLVRAELDQTSTKYDWVINARRSILRGKLEKPLAEFRQMVARIGESHDALLK